MDSNIPHGIQRSLMGEWLCNFIGGKTITPKEFVANRVAMCPPESKKVVGTCVKAFVDSHGEDKLMRMAIDTKAIVMTVAETLVRR